MRQVRFAGLVAVVMVVLGAAAGGLGAQQVQQGKALQFEVAAIKPGDSNSQNSGSSWSYSRFQLTNTPLKQWVEQGFSVSDYALKAPAWLDTARFDLNAKLPADVPKDHNPMPEMLRALLVERFGLKWHEETGTVSGFELVQDKKVLVQPATLMERMRGSHGSDSGPTTVNGTNMTMAVFAETLGKVLGKPVVDATHLDGGYDIKLRWRPDNEAELARQRQYGKQYGYDFDALPDSVFTAIREQLGLRLQAAKVPSRVIVVDSINRVPTAN
jgi:uncharacterized protein (TIGR03435 family)